MERYSAIKKMGLEVKMLSKITEETVLPGCGPSTHRPHRTEAHMPQQTWLEPHHALRHSRAPHPTPATWGQALSVLT